jgi:tRNA(fMet)-specific endonuclease VapC
MKIFLDTNILLYMIRGKKTYFVETFELDNPSNQVFTSVVTIGEMRALALQHNWGTIKNEELQRLYTTFPFLDINSNRILNRYAEIDTFSKGKLMGRPLVGSAHKMGKNDLWIAATASVLNATLITTDKDFSHLNNEFLRVIYVDPSSIV